MSPSNEYDADIVILGSGFAGSLTALIVQRIGLRPVVIDKSSHPRFAIGESSTPIANYVLRDLAREYDLPRLIPLAKWGTWQDTYPHVAAGVKRGFSYFRHEAGREFLPNADHANELLVAASSDDRVSDTHWFRSDVDRLLADEVRAANIPLLEDTCVTQLENDASDQWAVTGRISEQVVRIRAKFLIDATGAGGVLSEHFGFEDQSAQMQTNSRALFSHFTGITDWRSQLSSAGAHITDHPFDCDAAAQHHLLDGAWMWLLRFNNGLTSAGLMLDGKRHPIDAYVAPADEWVNWLSRYPSLDAMFENSRLADSPGNIVGTSRLQRRAAQLVGRNWALLPHTSGFVDPLHSTGIAHSLCGIERLTRIIKQHWGRDELYWAMRHYEQAVFAELDLIDELIAGCYTALVDFRLLAAFSMLYFAAVTTYEHRRADKHSDANDSFLCADDQRFRNIVRECSADLARLVSSGQPEPAAGKAFERHVAAAIAPYNRVGLCDPAARNMYRYTAAPDG